MGIWLGGGGGENRAVAHRDPRRADGPKDDNCGQVGVEGAGKESKHAWGMAEMGRGFEIEAGLGV